MNLIIKDKSLAEDLLYSIFDLHTGWRGMNRNPWLDPRPLTPLFDAMFRISFFNVKESVKFIKLLHNLMILGHYIDEIFIEKEFESDSLYEKVYIQSYSYGEERNLHCYKFNVHFEALKLTTILSPEEQRVHDALTLINTEELIIGVKN